MARRDAPLKSRGISEKPGAPRGLFDALLLVALVYAVYAMTPVGALAEYGMRAALGQRERPALFAAFRGHDTTVELSALPPGTSARLVRDVPPAMRAAAEAAAIDVQLLLALFAVHGTCDGPACTLTAPPHLQRALDGAGGGLAPRVGARVPLAHVARGLKHYADALAPEGSPAVRGALAVEALYAGPDAVAAAVQRARATGLAAGDVEAHAGLMPPAVRRGGLQRALQVLALHRMRTLAWPASPKWRLSSPYGVRVHPVLKTRKLHNGIDLAMPVGAALFAAHDGVVARRGQDAVSGRYLKIDHGFGIESTYCHLSSWTVAAHAPVTRGETVAKSGRSGRVTGPHLHYILRVHGETVDAAQYGAAPR